MAKTAKYVALRHKFIPGPRVLKASVYAAHLKTAGENSVFTLIGEADTHAAALALCTSSN
jgi:hypothetical protein